MDKSDEKTLHERIRDAYGDLAPAERRLADLILHFPGDMHGYTASELARMAETSNAAMSRFVRRLGFSGFEDMRIFARKESENGSPVLLMGRRSLQPNSNLLGRHAETVIGNIRRTVAGIDANSWASLVAAVAEARRVWIGGFRHGYYIAGYLRWSLAHVRDAVSLLPNAGETFGETLVDAGAEDVGILLAMRRRVPATAKLAKFFKGAGLRVALITDSSMAETFEADWVLRCASRTPGAVDDHASAIVLTHALTEALIGQLGRDAHKRFSTIDKCHNLLSELE
jgi:DNA-binding MurR/RpiR family transcriptional regulator